MPNPPRAVPLVRELPNQIHLVPSDEHRLVNHRNIVRVAWTVTMLVQWISFLIAAVNACAEYVPRLKCANS
jgi:hypothetical protein